MRSPWMFALGTAGVAVFCAATLSQTAAVPAAAPRFESRACWPQVPAEAHARCGFLVVPENRAKHDGKTIRVAVAIVPAAAEPDAGKAAGDPLVYLGGGPGGLPIFQTKQLIAAGFNAGRPLVIVDQRGTYLSEPALTCPEVDRFYKKMLGLRYDAPSTERALVAEVAACARRLHAAGADLSAYNTTENAADFADLRRVLGYPRWNVYGVSYGTDLALTLARTQPEGLRSLVLDSSVPPQAASLDAFWPNASDGFAALFAACASQAACAARYPKLDERFAALVRKLEAHPATTTVKISPEEEPVNVTTDGGALANWLVAMSFATPRYVEVPRWIAEFEAGDQAAIAGSRAKAVAPPGYIGYGLAFGVICSEWFPFGVAGDVERVARRAFPSYPASVLAQPPQFSFFDGICGVWNVPKAPAAMREPVVSGIPALILSGGFDAVTPERWAKLTASTLSNARIVTIPGTGHDVADASACARSAMNSFLNDTSAPNPPCVAALKAPAFDTP